MDLLKFAKKHIVMKIVHMFFFFFFFELKSM